jgi:ArsR family transcriptional regulator
MEAPLSTCPPPAAGPGLPDPAFAACCPPGPAAALAPRPDEEAELAALCKALAHPHRVHILRFLLAQQACYAGDIAQRLPVAPSTVSQHLLSLKEAGLIQGEVQGPRRCYCVAPGAVERLRALLEVLLVQP